MVTDEKVTHTPGPWRVDSMLGFPGSLGIGPAVGNRAIAVVTGDSSDGRHEANAQLIAAAPDLLTACKAAIGHGYLDTKAPASQDYVSKLAIECVRAAIAKAEGR
jgi:hypothetical protein